MGKIDTIIISDLHLGTPVSQSNKILKVLSSDFSRLIINGDLFDNHSFHRYKKEDWNILNKIRKIAKHKEVILVEGNHDGCSEFIAGITGMNMVPSYEFVINNHKHYCEHGHQYDKWTQDKPFVTAFFTGIYYYIQLAQKNQRISRKLKTISKSWIRAKDIIANGFVSKHGKEFNFIFAGHTHAPESRYYKEYDCWYFNSGSFCDTTCSYIKIAEDGIPDIILL
jgi:UDP-2,3-diacylglucosamine pyrophosphatase LpxH